MRTTIRTCDKCGATSKEEWPKGWRLFTVNSGHRNTMFDLDLCPECVAVLEPPAKYSYERPPKFLGFVLQKLFG